MVVSGWSMPGVKLHLSAHDLSPSCLYQTILGQLPRQLTIRLVAVYVANPLQFMSQLAAVCSSCQGTSCMLGLLCALNRACTAWQ